MSAFRPFAARVVRPERAMEVVTPLVDPVDERAETPHPRTDVDPTAYADAGTAYFVYRQRRGLQDHTGIVCEVSPEAFEDGRVRGHEAVRPERVASLVEHLATTERPALVALLHAPGPAYVEAVASAVAGEPMLDAPGPDGLRQTVWRVPDEHVTALTEELAAARHYVADGHHRVAASLRRWRDGALPAGAGVPSVVYPLDGLRLAAFHRRVTGPVTEAEVCDVLAGAFEVHAVESPPGPAPGRFGLYLGGRWSLASYRGVRPDGPAGLDVSLLDDLVLGPLLADTHRQVEVAAARTPLAELTGRCDADGGLLLTVAPPRPQVITAVADRGEVMPPKTTFFEPKPCAGIFLRA